MKEKKLYLDNVIDQMTRWLKMDCKELPKDVMEAIIQVYQVSMNHLFYGITKDLEEQAKQETEEVSK